MLLTHRMLVLNWPELIQDHLILLKKVRGTAFQKFEYDH